MRKLIQEGLAYLDLEDKAVFFVVLVFAHDLELLARRRRVLDAMFGQHSSHFSHSFFRGLGGGHGDV